MTTFTFVWAMILGTERHWKPHGNKITGSTITSGELLSRRMILDETPPYRAIDKDDMV